MTRRARDGEARATRPPLAAPAERRAAATRGPGPGAGQPAPGAPARRAARRARSQAPEGDAARAQAPADRPRDHLRVRDARPGGGAHHERPDRAHAAGADRAGRHARATSTTAPPRATSPTSSARPICSPAWSRRAAAAWRRSGVGDDVLSGPERRRPRRPAARPGSPSAPRRSSSAGRRGAAGGQNIVSGTVRDAVYAGSALRVHVALAGGQRLVANVPSDGGSRRRDRSASPGPASTARCVGD